jgi:hypothetical protein
LRHCHGIGQLGDGRASPAVRVHVESGLPGIGQPILGAQALGGVLIPCLHQGIRRTTGVVGECKRGGKFERLREAFHRALSIPGRESHQPDVRMWIRKCRLQAYGLLEVRQGLLRFPC